MNALANQQIHATVNGLKNLQTWKRAKDDPITARYPLPPGEWDAEPDKAQWIDPMTGLDCLIVRGPLGALCGYVGVPPDHEYYEVDYSQVGVSIHGGLTYSNFCREDDAEHGICHTGQVANAKVWWLGFDCGHYHDQIPGLDHGGNFGVYRNFTYVVNEVERLALQLISDDSEAIET